MSARYYPIGIPGQPWGASERTKWLAQQTAVRSYGDDVLQRLDDLGDSFVVETYGALSHDPKRYPLRSVRSAKPLPGVPWALVTGGVHGYETSGVQGAIAFLQDAAREYVDQLNLLVLPCVSPWGYEFIQRWNPTTVDPNRSFIPNSPSEESAAVMEWISKVQSDFLVHIDLHETTDTDESEFRPALAARDGQEFVSGVIPDGFYLVGDTNNPQPDFQNAILQRVSTVTHIAPSDDAGELIGVKVESDGVILYPYQELGLCAGVTGARLTTTTEVYPDSAKTTSELCNVAQVAAVRAALDFALMR